MPTDIAPSGQSIRDTIIKSAQSFPDLLSQAEVLDPSLAKALKAKASPASLTPVGAAIGGILAGISSHFALGWDASFDQMVAGLGALAFGYLVHFIQSWMAKPIAEGK